MSLNSLPFMLQKKRLWNRSEEGKYWWGMYFFHPVALRIEMLTLTDS